MDSDKTDNTLLDMQLDSDDSNDSNVVTWVGKNTRHTLDLGENAENFSIDLTPNHPSGQQISDTDCPPPPTTPPLSSSSPTPQETIDDRLRTVHTPIVQTTFTTTSLIPEVFSPNPPTPIVNQDMNNLITMMQQLFHQQQHIIQQNLEQQKIDTQLIMQQNLEQQKIDTQHIIQQEVNTIKQNLNQQKQDLQQEINNIQQNLTLGEAKQKQNLENILHQTENRLQQNNQIQIDSLAQSIQEQIIQHQGKLEVLEKGIAEKLEENKTTLINIRQELNTMSDDCRTRTLQVETKVNVCTSEIVSIKQKIKSIETCLAKANMDNTQVKVTPLTNVQMETECSAVPLPVNLADQVITQTFHRTDSLSSESIHSEPHTSRHECRQYFAGHNMQTPTFKNDSSQTAPQFIEELNSYFEFSGLTEDREKIRALPQFLVGNPQKWCRIESTRAQSWKDLCQKFISQFYNKAELAQEWEVLEYRNYHNDCESFVIKAWQLQSTLHPQFSDYKIGQNVIGKLPQYLQSKVNERENRDFNELLRNVKEVEKRNYNRYKEVRKENTNPYTPRYSQQPPQRNFNETQTRNPNFPRNTFTYNSAPQQQYNRNTHFNTNNSSYNPRPQNYTRKIFSRNKNSNSKPYENRKYNNNKINHNKKESCSQIGVIKMVPIKGQSGSYRVVDGREHLSSCPRSYSRSPKRDRQGSRSPSPLTSSQTQSVTR